MANRFIACLTMCIGIFSLWACSVGGEGKPSGIRHVVLIGFDGLSPDGIQGAATPNFDRLITQGAHTFHARAVLPTSSSSNWSSMIMGAGPEHHGITSNDWERDHFMLPAVVQGEQFLFPTIFRLINEQLPSAEIGAIYHWKGFGRLFEKNAVDYYAHGKSEEETASLAVNYITERQPTFTFIHFDHVDHAGHEFGHGTGEYYKAVEKADELLGRIMHALKRSGMYQHSLVVVSADHGGVGKGHGGESLEEIEIPFILWGTAVKKGYEITYPVYQYDNAATVAFALGIEPPHAWIGKPALMAFEGFEVTDPYPMVALWPEPAILPGEKFYKRAGGLFTDSTYIHMKNPDMRGEIRYTLDGSAPAGSSGIYMDSIKIKHNAVVRAAIFDEGIMKSGIAEGFFRVRDSNQVPPVAYEVYHLKDLKQVPSLENHIPYAKGRCFEITSDELKIPLKPDTAVRFRTTLNIESTGTYKFFTRSDDGSKLWIDGEEVVDNDGDHGVIEKEGEIKLNTGPHELEVIWFNGGGSGWLDVYFQGPGGIKQIIPPSILN